MCCLLPPQRSPVLPFTHILSFTRVLPFTHVLPFTKVCTSILRHPSSGEIGPDEWSFLIRGPVGLPFNSSLTRPSWVGEAMWKSIIFADTSISILEGIALSVTTCSDAWEAWAASSEPQSTPLPDGWEKKLDAGHFGRLCIVKIFREEKLIFACNQYVGIKLGPAFTEPAPWNLDDVFPDTTCRTPVIFILSTGASEV